MRRLLNWFVVASVGLCASVMDNRSFADDGITYANTVASIVHEHCSGCHRPKQSGPFELLTYEDVVAHSETIRAVLQDGYMPPWKPVPSGLEFSNDRRLSRDEKEKILQWIEAGCPPGDLTKSPKLPDFPDGWSLGTPDLVVKMERAFQVPADGPDLYRSFVFPLDLPEDKWVKAIELRPTARGAVHHALFFVDTEGVARHQKSRDGQPGFTGMNFLRGRSDALERMPEGLARGLGGYVPGATPNRLPGDLARHLPAGSDIVMQTHFHPTGKVEYEQSELGLYFASKPPRQQLVTIQLPPLFGMGAGIDVPAGDSDYLVRDEYVLPVDIRGFEIGGHAHYICREMRMNAELPDGSNLALLRIDDWDLDWQDQYQYAKSVELPKGTKLVVEIVYDNSASNPENPFSPPQDIAWGRESTDEMGSISLLAIAKNEAERPTLEADLRKKTRKSLSNRVRQQTGRLGDLVGGGEFRGGLLQVLDRNRDGKLSKEELPERFRDRVLDLMDSNNDEVLDRDEIESGKKTIQSMLRDRE